jgi:hypothetical protein
MVCPDPTISECAHVRKAFHALRAFSALLPNHPYGFPKAMIEDLLPISNGVDNSAENRHFGEKSDSQGSSPITIAEICNSKESTNRRFDQGKHYDKFSNYAENLFSRFPPFD